MAIEIPGQDDRIASSIPGFNQSNVTTMPARKHRNTSNATVLGLPSDIQKPACQIIFIGTKGRARDIEPMSQPPRAPQGRPWVGAIGNMPVRNGTSLYNASMTSQMVTDDLGAIDLMQIAMVGGMTVCVGRKR